MNVDKQYGPEISHTGIETNLMQGSGATGSGLEPHRIRLTKNQIASSNPDMYMELKKAGYYPRPIFNQDAYEFLPPSDPEHPMNISPQEYPIHYNKSLVLQAIMSGIQTQLPSLRAQK